MSLLKVNSIEAYSGSSISLSSDILFKNITTGSSVSFLGIDISGKIISGSTVGSTLNIDTISANNYIGLPSDVKITGGTYDSGTATFTNSTGGTFNVDGFYTGYTAPIDVLVKFTLYGAQPSLLTTVKPATGAWALATAVSKRNIQNIA